MWVIHLVLSLAALYAAIIAVMYFAQTWLLFPTLLARVTRVRLPESTQRLKVGTPDGESLIGVRIPSAGGTVEGAPSLLGFGGNAWNAETMVLITPFNLLMGLYVHSGFEFFPKWWNRSRLTKWFITATFHDQHHRYFKGNYGGYTTIWDRICGTEHPRYREIFREITARGKGSAKTESGPAAATIG